MKDGFLQNSIDGSLFIQFITLVLNLFAFLVPLNKWDFALKQILGLETFVQIVELLFYTWYREHLIMSTNNVTQFRYYDWFITTPMMLFSTASYYGYVENREKNSKEPFSVFSFFKENSSWITLLFLLNASMLFFGYLHEIGLLSIVWSSLFGYVSLIGSFSILYRFVSKVADSQQWLFKWMFGIWSLYGIAAMLPSLEKNIMYNGLDIVAKNFYGVFLSYLIYRQRI